jgi:hypothetical protein
VHPSVPRCRGRGVAEVDVQNGGGGDLASLATLRTPGRAVCSAFPMIVCVAGAPGCAPSARSRTALPVGSPNSRTSTALQIANAASQENRPAVQGGQAGVKLCDTIGSTGMYRMRNAVHHAAVRCDGQAHGGCQARLPIYWRQVWLKRVPAGEPGRHRRGGCRRHRGTRNRGGSARS